MFWACSRKTSKVEFIRVCHYHYRMGNGFNILNLCWQRPIIIFKICRPASCMHAPKCAKKNSKIRAITWCYDIVIRKNKVQFLESWTWSISMKKRICIVLIVPFLEHNVRGSMHLYFGGFVSSSSKLCVYYNYTLLRYFTFTVCTEITEKSAILVQKFNPQKNNCEFYKQQLHDKFFFFLILWN